MHKAGWLAAGMAAMTGVAMAAGPTVTTQDYDRAVRMLADRTTPLVDDVAWLTQWKDDGGTRWIVKTRDGVELRDVDSAGKTSVVATVPSNAVSWNERGSLKFTHDGKRYTCGFGATECEPAGAATPDPKPGDGPAVASPDGTREVFIRDWNLWLRDRKSGAETQLTRDGSTDYGYATDNAGWTHSDRAIVVWSPQGDRIATFKQDQRKTSTMTMVQTNIGAPKVQQWKYPFAGDKDVTMIERVIIDLTGSAPAVVRIQLPPEQHRSTYCDDISCDGGWEDVQWGHDGKTLAFVSTDRAHKSAQLRVADAATGTVRDVLREDVATHFESGQGAVGWRYLSKTNEVLWSSQRSGWQHLYLYAMDGKLKRQLTKGNWLVGQLVRVDEDARMVWFNGYGREAGNPYLSHFYRVGLDDGRLTTLTPEDAYHRVALSPDGTRFIDIASTATQAPVARLRDAMTGAIKAEIAKGDLARLLATGWKPLEEFTVAARDGKTALYGQLFKPSHFDASKKYPVVVYIYPGPQSQSVRSRSFIPAHGDHQALAELGFIVMAVDGMGTPLRGKAFHDTWYGNMGDNTLPDQVAAVKQLAARFPWFDGTRVGMWGHSGGGYATAGALLRYPEVFKVGIAEAGNHDNRSYEDDWGERYIGLVETKPDGTSNYDDQANATHAKNLKGKLFLIHGMLDDNVPVQNTLLLADALLAANKDFDMLLLPQARHGFGQYSNHVMRRRWDYFITHLLGGTHPSEYRIAPAN